MLVARIVNEISYFKVRISCGGIEVIFLILFFPPQIFYFNPIILIIITHYVDRE